MSKKHDDYIKSVADKLIEQIKNNEAPWQKPWTGSEFMTPVNHQGRGYRGMNSLKLLMEAHEKGYQDNRWYTYANAKEAGGQVRRGEKGTPIMVFITTERVDKTDQNGNVIKDENGKPIKEEVKLDRPKVMQYHVFNAEQVDGIPPRQLPPAIPEWQRHAKAEAIISGIQEQGLSIVHRAGDRAFYNPSQDQITMPERGQFASGDLYYATVLHEIGHATGHESRLNRDLSGSFGSVDYAKEELRAEIASMMVGQELQIGHDPSQHYAYLESWVKVLQDDPKEIFRAVKDADIIRQYVLDYGRDIDIEHEAVEQSPSISNIRIIWSELSYDENIDIENAAELQKWFLEQSKNDLPNDGTYRKNKISFDIAGANHTNRIDIADTKEDFNPQKTTWIEYFQEQVGAIQGILGDDEYQKLVAQAQAVTDEFLTYRAQTDLDILKAELGNLGFYHNALNDNYHLFEYNAFAGHQFIVNYMQAHEDNNMNPVIAMRQLDADGIVYDELINLTSDQQQNVPLIKDATMRAQEMVKVMQQTADAEIVAAEQTPEFNTKGQQLDYEYVKPLIDELNKLGYKTEIVTDTKYAKYTFHLAIAQGDSRAMILPHQDRRSIALAVDGDYMRHVFHTHNTEMADIAQKIDVQISSFSEQRSQAASLENYETYLEHNGFSKTNDTTWHLQLDNNSRLEVELFGDFRISEVPSNSPSVAIFSDLKARSIGQIHDEVTDSSMGDMITWRNPLAQQNIAEQNTPINVPYKEKNEAKALGAKWDNTNKTWYIPAGEDMGKFGKWYSQEIKQSLPSNHREYFNKIQGDFKGAQVERIANSFLEAREQAKEFISKDLSNFLDGRTAIISNKNLDKMLSSKAHEKSGDLHLHLTAVANADKLFENSVFGWKMSYKNDSPDVVAVHRAIAPMKFEGQVYLAKLTVKELAGEQGSRVYSIEALEIDNEKSPVPEMTEEDTKKYSVTPHRLNGALIDIIVKNAQDYNRQNEKNIQSYGLPTQSQQQPSRTYLYTNPSDNEALQQLKADRIVAFDVGHKLWYLKDQAQADKVGQWTNRPYIPTPEEALADHLRASGISVPAGHPIMDGRTHRLSNEGSTDKNVMYQAYTNQGGVPFARITNFSRGGTPENWKYPIEYTKIKANIDAVDIANSTSPQQSAQPSQAQQNVADLPTVSQLNQDVSAEIKQAQELAAMRAKMLIGFAPLADSHNYLNKKQVTANGLLHVVPSSDKLPEELKEHILIGNTPKQFSYLRQTNPDKMVLQRGNLIVPQYNAQGELRAFETIGYYGNKYAQQGAEKNGLSLAMGKVENGKPVIITEGYATGATLHEQTNQAVVVAFGKGGLLDVAKSIRDQLPDSKIYIGADNDHQKSFEINPNTSKPKENTGLVNAQKVADSVSNVHLLIPQFARGETGKDWNDVYVDKGVDELKRQLKEQLQSINADQYVKQAQDTKKPEIAYPDPKQTLDINKLRELNPNLSVQNLETIKQWQSFIDKVNPSAQKEIYSMIENQVANLKAGEKIMSPHEMQHAANDKGIEPDTGSGR